MRIGWLADEHDPPGGAELTQAEFRAAAPKDVEVVDCPPGGVVEGLEAYVVHNVMTYSAADLANVSAMAFKYHHDTRLFPHPGAMNAEIVVPIYCSPALAAYFGVPDGEVVPPPINLNHFKPSRQHRRNGKREGAVCVGAMLNPGKGGHLLAEWAEEHGPLDFYGYGPYAPSESAYVTHLGRVDQGDLPKMLWKYETFVFLPSALEPFGRAVVEAWAAGCELVVNGLVGARHWITEEPEKLETAAEDFWKVVLS